MGLSALSDHVRWDATLQVPGRRASQGLQEWGPRNSYEACVWILAVSHWCARLYKVERRSRYTAVGLSMNWPELGVVSLPERAQTGWYNKSSKRTRLSPRLSLLFIWLILSVVTMFGSDEASYNCIRSSLFVVFNSWSSVTVKRRRWLLW